MCAALPGDPGQDLRSFRHDIPRHHLVSPRRRNCNGSTRWRFIQYTDHSKSIDTVHARAPSHAVRLDVIPAKPSASRDHSVFAELPGDPGQDLRSFRDDIRGQDLVSPRGRNCKRLTKQSVILYTDELRCSNPARIHTPSSAGHLHIAPAGQTTPAQVRCSERPPQETLPGHTSVRKRDCAPSGQAAPSQARAKKGVAMR
jgi:hypothetical protein